MNMAVSGTTEVGTGMGMRFVGGALTTGGNLKEAWAQTINPQSILFDATLGASMGGVKGLQKPQQINADLNSPEQSNADVKSLEDTAKHQDSLEKESKFVNSTDKVALKNDSTKIASYIEDSGWSSDIVEKIDNDEQYDIYKNADLHEEEVNGRKCLVKDIDFDYVRYLNGMFYNCYSLTSLNLSNFNSNNVNNMSGMFSDCSSLTSLNTTDKRLLNEWKN